jgi:hypothetical protein
MHQFGGKDSKRHFTVVMGGKEHGLYVSSTPSSAARKAVTKLCTANKSKKVEFHIREITQGSKKKTYGPYLGHIEKLKEPIELKGRVIKYKPVAKLSGKKGVMKGGAITSKDFIVDDKNNLVDYKYVSSFFGKNKLFFAPKYKNTYFTIALNSDGSFDILTDQLKVFHFDSLEKLKEYQDFYYHVLRNLILNDEEKFSPKIKESLKILRTIKEQKIQQEQQQ